MISRAPWKRRHLRIIAHVARSMLVCVEVILAQTPTVTLNNTSEFEGNGNYSWTIFVDEDQSVLARIKLVEYTLHPTFPNPVRRVTTRENRFALTALGWGEFRVYAKVFFTDGKVINCDHWLTLTQTGVHPPSKKDVKVQPSLSSAPVTMSPVSPSLERAPISAGNSSINAGNGRWRWTIFIQARDDVLAQVRYVEYTLHPTFPNPVRRVSERGNERGKGFALSATGWGTFEVAIKVQFNTGATRYLKHRLQFVN